MLCMLTGAGNLCLRVCVLMQQVLCARDIEDRSVAVVSSVWLKGANSCHWPPENAKSVNRETLDCSTILKTLSLQDPQCVRLTNKNIYLNTVDRGNMGTRVIWAHRCNFFTYCCHKATPNESSSVFWL